MKRAILLVTALGTLTAGASSALAQRKNPLEEQPAVRKRFLYRPNKFEIAPMLGLTFLQDFKHAFLIGVDMQYHIPWCFGAKYYKECLSVGVSFAYAPVDWDTELTSEIKDTLHDTFDNPDINPAPTRQALDDAFNHIVFMVNGPYIAYHPWLGKMSLLGYVFFDFDFYLSIGMGMVYLKAGNIAKYADALNLSVEEENGGLRFGPSFGFGARFYILNWLAVHVKFTDIYLSQTLGQGRNAAGFDRNGSVDPQTGRVTIDKEDATSEHVMYFTVGVSFFLPPGMRVGP